jgi:CRISPR-associated protein Cas2
MGWLIVAFDLPVGTRKQRKQATGFRNYLIDDGYQMVQFSVYARACVSFARQETHIDRLKKNLPPEGNPRTAGRSGCTPAEPYPPSRTVSLKQK